jgi:hypothetical protein
MICSKDFHDYLSIRIRDGDLIPWIACPADDCSIPCHPHNITDDGGLTSAELLRFICVYMLKMLSRNENFISCSQCLKGGFLQLGPSRKEQVQCPFCQTNQQIEKGFSWNTRSW